MRLCGRTAGERSRFPAVDGTGTDSVSRDTVFEKENHRPSDG